MLGSSWVPLALPHNEVAMRIQLSFHRAQIVSSVPSVGSERAGNCAGYRQPQMRVRAALNSVVASARAATLPKLPELLNVRLGASGHTKQARLSVYTPARPNGTRRHPDLLSRVSVWIVATPRSPRPSLRATRGSQGLLDPTRRGFACSRLAVKKGGRNFG
jgi:hypothetical protein